MRLMLVQQDILAPELSKSFLFEFDNMSIRLEWAFLIFRGDNKTIKRNKLNYHSEVAIE